MRDTREVVALLDALDARPQTCARKVSRCEGRGKASVWNSEASIK
jgi:hypothetical protein